MCSICMFVFHVLPRLLELPAAFITRLSRRLRGRHVDSTRGGGSSAPGEKPRVRSSSRTNLNSAFYDIKVTTLGLLPGGKVKQDGTPPDSPPRGAADGSESTPVLAGLLLSGGGLRSDGSGTGSGTSPVYATRMSRFALGLSVGASLTIQVRSVHRAYGPRIMYRSLKLPQPFVLPPASASKASQQPCMPF